MYALIEIHEICKPVQHIIADHNHKVISYKGERVLHIRDILHFSNAPKPDTQFYFFINDEYSPYNDDRDRLWHKSSLTIGGMKVTCGWIFIDLAPSVEVIRSIVTTY